MTSVRFVPSNTLKRCPPDWSGRPSERSALSRCCLSPSSSRGGSPRCRHFPAPNARPATSSRRPTPRPPSSCWSCRWRRCSWAASSRDFLASRAGAGSLSFEWIAVGFGASFFLAQRGLGPAKALGVGDPRRGGSRGGDRRLPAFFPGCGASSVNAGGVPPPRSSWPAPAWSSRDERGFRPRASRFSRSGGGRSSRRIDAVRPRRGALPPGVPPPERGVRAAGRDGVDPDRRGRGRDRLAGELAPGSCSRLFSRRRSRRRRPSSASARPRCCGAARSRRSWSSAPGASSIGPCSSSTSSRTACRSSARSSISTARGPMWEWRRSTGGVRMEELRLLLRAAVRSDAPDLLAAVLDLGRRRGALPGRSVRRHARVRCGAPSPCSCAFRSGR